MQKPTSRARAPEQEVSIGHGSKFTPERCAGIIACIRAGNYANVAARANGIGEECLSKWRNEGRREPEGRYGAFAAACDEAEAAAEVEVIARIAKAGLEGDWKADAWRLERRYAERWRQRTETKTELTGANGGPVQTQSMPPAVARAELLAGLAKELGADEAERVVRRMLGEPEPVASLEAEASKEEP